MGSGVAGLMEDVCSWEIAESDLNGVVDVGIRPAEHRRRSRRVAMVRAIVKVVAAMAGDGGELQLEMNFCRNVCVTMAPAYAGHGRSPESVCLGSPNLD